MDRCRCDVTLNVCLGKELTIAEHKGGYAVLCCAMLCYAVLCYAMLCYKEFTGAGLTLCGLRGSASGDERRFCHRHAHVPGRAIMHLGRQHSIA